MEMEMKRRFGKNLKFLRERANLTQAALADLLADYSDKKNVHKSIGSYEQGNAFPSIPMIRAILAHFQISFEWMVNYGFSDLSENDFQAIIHPPKAGLQVLAISVDPDNKEKIELVREKASAGYIKGFADTSYIKQLEKFHMPWLPPEYTYRAFEISGDSMPPIQSGSIVLGKYVEDKSSLKKGERYIIISKEGILFKRVYFPTPSKNPQSLLLTSDNPRYEPYELPLQDVLEVWQFYAYVALCNDK